MSDVIGSAEFELRARRDQLKKDLNDSERDLKDWGDRAESTANSSAGGIARATRSITAGIVALTAAAAAGLAIAFQFGQASLKMADNLANSAQRIGISTDALQEWQYVARKTGQEADAVAGSLDTFADKLASAAAGLSKNDLKLFQSIGLDQADLRSFRDTETALDEVIDRITALQSEADRSAIAEKLGLEPLSNALREGADEIDRLRGEAQSLGFVLDAELIQKGTIAQGKLEDLSQVVGIQLAGAFIGLSDEVLAFTGWLANALNKLNEFAEAFDRFERKGQALTQANTMRLQGVGNAVGSLFRGDFGGVRDGWRQMNGANDLYWRIQRGEGVDDDDPALVNQRMPPAPPAPQNRRLPYSPNLSVPQRGDRSDERSAEREARRAERVEQEIFRARQRLLQVAEQDVLTAQQRFELAQSQLRMEREARDAEIESKAARGEIKAAERRSLEAANAEADALEDRVVADNAFREIQDERLANERLLADLTADLLSLQSGAARTAAERRRLELELLEITQQQRRDALRLELDRNPSLTAQQRADAMAANGRVENAERAAVNRSTMSPLEAWRDESLRTADEIAEAYENVAARGLDALNEGLVDAIMNSRSLGETFSQVARQILADLLSISVRRGITEPLAGLLFGGDTGGSTGGMFAGFGSWLKGKIPGFSSGVTNFSGGLAYVHQGEVLANLAPGTDVIPAHAVGGMGGGGPVRVIVETNDDRFNAYVDNRVAPQASAAFTGARQTVPSDMARTSKYTLSGRR